MADSPESPRRFHEEAIDAYAVAVSYAGELARSGIETSIVVPGAFTQGTNHFLHAGKPADDSRQAEYDDGPNRGLAEKAMQNLAVCEPLDADPASVVRAIVDVVNAPFGQRPLNAYAISAVGLAITAAALSLARLSVFNSLLGFFLGLVSYFGNLKSRVGSSTSPSK